jgi:hypothetical protein
LRGRKFARQPFTKLNLDSIPAPLYDFTLGLDQLLLS